MMILISGKNSSGKSAFAEKLSVMQGERRYYIATMQPWGEEGAARVRKHRCAREGLGFETLELPYSVGAAGVSPNSVVLLEDVSNLLANAMFEKRKNEDEVYNDILSLQIRCKLLIIVTISGFEQGNYDTDTSAYMAALERLNSRLLDAAETALTMRDGSAVLEKGSLPCV